MKRKFFLQFSGKFFLLGLISIAFFQLMFTNCVKDEYNLDNGIITEVTVGGDSLLIQIGKTKPIRLDSMIKEKDISLLKKSADGAYSLSKGDSLKVDVQSINPVSFSINPIVVNPTVINFADLQFPEFIIDPVNSQTSISTPSFAVDKGIDPVNVSTDITSSIKVNAPRRIKGNRSAKDQITVGPFVVAGSGDFTQVIDISTYPTELKKVDKIYVKNNTVTIHFDKAKVNALPFTSRSEVVQSFRIDFPAEYHISGAQGANSRIEGNSFIIENAALNPTVDIVEYSFKLDYLDVENITQNGSLSMSRTVPYSLQYQISGDVSSASDVDGKVIDLGLTIQTAPAVSDLELESNSTAISMNAGNESFDKQITGIPSEVSFLKEVTLEPGAYIQLKITDPNISPFSLSNGNIEISLPKSFVFKPMAGLNTSTNVLTLPYNDMFGTKQIDVASIIVNQNIDEGVGAFTLSESLSYSANNLAIGGIRTMLSSVQGLGTKSVNFSGDFFNFKVKDASVITRKISAVLPDKTSTISVNHFVSKDVKKLYLANLVNPAALNIKLSVTDLPLVYDSLFFYNFKIKFPQSLKFAAGTVNSQNEIILNRGFKVSQGFLKTMSIEGFDFGTDGLALVNGNFNFNESVTLSGSVYVKGKDLKATDMGSITVKPTIEIGDMTIGYVEGYVSPTIDAISKVVILDLPAFLKQAGTKMDITNPVISLEVGNTTGIGVDLNLELIPKRNGSVIAAGKITTSMSIAAASELGKPTWSKFWIAPTDAGVSAGYTAIIVPNLPELLKTVPDEVEIKVTPVVVGTKQKVDLQSLVNQMKVKYNFHIPLDFGKDFEIQYTDSVSDLQAKLKDVTKYTRALDLIALIDNEIPLDLGLELIPLDAQKQVISGISITQINTIKSCNLDGTAQRTNLNLGLKETTVGALDLLDTFSFKISAKKNSTVAGLPLNANQSVTISLKVRIPEGLTVK
ncbi:MAG: hypothetical protein PHV20_00230 [Bacteroidales bacterium]|nr:hypothetical protein [Bacteroidales bacterium]